MLKVLKSIIIGSKIYKADEIIKAPDDISEESVQALIDSGYLESAEVKIKEPEKLFYPENEALELIEEALTIAELDEVIEGDNRKKILKAAEKKKKELEAELETEAGAGE